MKLMKADCVDARDVEVDVGDVEGDFGWEGCEMSIF